MGEKSLSNSRSCQKLIAARLAPIFPGTPTVLLARTDPEAANLLTSDIDERDQEFCTVKELQKVFIV
ncbi:MAG: hypothetical protein Ct9H90mP18_01160 [Gammaproteobacteria bacterium]|nr:MAG: hypothetical protein Ct9H90mP18_01160 [Gammaproteobacteria bacterium]